MSLRRRLSRRLDGRRAAGGRRLSECSANATSANLFLATLKNGALLDAMRCLREALEITRNDASERAALWLASECTARDG